MVSKKEFNELAEEIIEREGTEFGEAVSSFIKNFSCLEYLISDDLANTVYEEVYATLLEVRQEMIDDGTWYDTYGITCFNKQGEEVEIDSEFFQSMKFIDLANKVSSQKIVLRNDVYYCYYWDESYFKELLGLNNVDTRRTSH